MSTKIQKVFQTITPFAGINFINDEYLPDLSAFAVHCQHVFAG